MIGERIAVRPPDVVMRLDRMGCFHQTRLSFMRGLLRRLKNEQWTFSRPVWRIDNNGVGVAVYCAHGPAQTYSLVCFAHDPNPEDRSDRSIATEWDATFALFDGVPTEQDIDRLSLSVPKQEAGRVSKSELSISRANRSVRLFNYVLACLASGSQPEADQVSAVGYLMRTTAVYGSGKFGAASFDTISSRPEFSRPFQVEMLSVYLARAFSVDLVEQLARVRSPNSAVTLAPELRRTLGMGNATGLGMAPFLVTHPGLINNWIAAREEALARVRNQTRASQDQIVHFGNVFARTQQSVDQWRTGHEQQSRRIDVLKHDLTTLREHLDLTPLTADFPWDALYRWSERNVSLECQELLVSLLMEPHGELIDELADRMCADEKSDHLINGAMTVEELQRELQSNYAWALRVDFGSPSSKARYWYVSENKLEPRLGDRTQDAQVEQREMPLGVARDVIALSAALMDQPLTERLAHFLLRHPEHRHTVRRVQIAAVSPYAEIRENLLSSDFLPIDLLRCKLSFFGAAKFDPQSDRWVRITLFQHAPFPDELASMPEDEWMLPPIAQNH